MKYGHRLSGLVSVLACVFLGAAHAAAQSSELLSGQSLSAGQYLTTPAGDRTGCAFRATFDATGVLTLRNGATVLWTSRVAAPNSTLYMQPDGNVTIKNAANRIFWQTRTNAPGSRFGLLNDGNLVVIRSDLSLAWQTSTALHQCNVGKAGPQGLQGIPGVAGARAVVQSNFAIPGQDCPARGTVVESFTDVDANGEYNAGTDLLYNRKVICDGADGKTGAITRVLKTPIAPGQSSCPAGGTRILAYRDLDTITGWSAGDTPLFENSVCNGIKGDTGDRGAVGDKGAKGDSGASGASAVIVSRDLPAEADGLCPHGGKLYSSWTDVVSDADSAGQPVFTIVPVNGVTDINLREHPVCAGPSGKSVVAVKSSADDCATGGWKYDLFRDGNNNGRVDGDDALLQTFRTCNGLAGADGYVSMVAATPLPHGHAQCPGGGVQYEICLDSDRNGTCGDGDRNRSTPVVCDGAKVGITMETLAHLCGGVGGTRLITYTDVDASGTLTGPDTNVAASVICAGAAGPSSGNYVVTADSVPDPTRQCAALEGLTRFTTFADTNSNGVFDDGEPVTRRISFCAGETTTDRARMMDDVGNMIASQIQVLNARVVESIGALQQAAFNLDQRLQQSQEFGTQVAELLNQIRREIADLERNRQLISQFVTMTRDQIDAVATSSGQIAGGILEIRQRIMSLEGRGLGLNGMELRRLMSVIEGEIAGLAAEVAALKVALDGQNQGLISDAIANADTASCPLGSGGTRVTLCPMINGVCDRATATTSVNICNAAWSGRFVSGVVNGLRSDGLVLANGDANQEIGMPNSGLDAMPFSFLVLPGQRYSITVASSPANTSCTVLNGSGVVATTDITNVVINCATPWTTARLSEPRICMAATTAGSKVLFAGGLTPNSLTTDRVDILDTVTRTWTLGHLAVPRMNVLAASVGTKAVFTGAGEGDVCNVVDIYDSQTDSWSTVRLDESSCPFDIATNGNIALIVYKEFDHVGMFRSTHVRAFDSTSNTWSILAAPVLRDQMALSTSGAKSYFMGGRSPDNMWAASSTINIFDIASQTWSTDSMPIARYAAVSASVGDKVLVAGGGYGHPPPLLPESRVDIFNTSMGTWTRGDMSQGRINTGNNTCRGVTAGHQVLFACGTVSWGSGGGVVDIFDASTSHWAVSQLSEMRQYVAPTSLGNQAFFAGGLKPPYAFSDLVDIYTAP